MKKIIIAVVITTLAVIIALLLLKNYSLNIIEQANNNSSINDIHEKEEEDNSLKLLNNMNESYTIYKILKSYNLYLNYLDFDVNTYEGFLPENVTQNELKEEYKKEGLKALSEIIDDECQDKCYKDANEMYEKLNKYANTELNIKDIYIIKNNSNINKYIIKLVSDEYIGLKTDTTNNTFSIFTHDFFENVEDIKTVEMNDSSIIMQNYNRYNKEKIDEQGIINEYFSIYQNAISNNIEQSFLLLEEEYQKSKFNNIDEYKQYIEKNYKPSNLDKYQKNEYGDKKHYVCIDNDSNYYIFIEKRPFSFSVILDTYTTNIPEFTEKYDKADDAKKVAYNIEKLVSAINNGDFGYVYGKMDNSFKQANFPTLEVFEQNAKTLFFEKNKVQYLEHEQKGDTHIYTISLSDYSEEYGQTKNKQIFMQLKENYDFVFSFNLEEI